MARLVRAQSLVTPYKILHLDVEDQKVMQPSMYICEITSGIHAASFTLLLATLKDLDDITQLIYGSFSQVMRVHLMGYFDPSDILKLAAKYEYITGSDPSDI
jgi:hypothetical protein